MKPYHEARVQTKEEALCSLALEIWKSVEGRRSRLEGSRGLDLYQVMQLPLGFVPPSRFLIMLIDITAELGHPG